MKDNKISSISLLNYFYIVLTLLWLPLQKTVLHIDGKGRILCYLTILVLLINSQYRNFRRIAFSKPAAIWLVWCLYIIIKVFIQGYSVNSLPIGFFIILKVLSPYVILVVSAYEYSKNCNRYLKSMLTTFVIYSVIGFFFMDNFYAAMQEGRSADNTLGNLLALNSVFITFFAALLCNRKVLTKRLFYVFAAFSILIITLSATRKAFGAVFIIYIFFLLSDLKLTFGNVVKLILLFVVLYWGINMMIDNTFIGERFLAIDESAEMFTDSKNPLLKLVGDRAFFYIVGWEVFLKNFVFGIGITNFPIYTETELMIHTEYIVQLCECGIVGTFLFVYFFVSLIKCSRTNVAIIQDKSLTTTMLGGICAILFIGITAWIYEFSFYFAVLGTIIGQSKIRSVK